MTHIIEFQKKHGLTPDGKIGKITIQKMRCVFGIQTDSQMSHFLANLHHETGNFTADTENLNYSSQGLAKIFKKYFPTPALANQYAGKPQAIANRVYANRGGNGNEASGDGWKWRGRGSLQTTFKDNYKAFAEFIKDPQIMLNPDLVATKYFWESALFYFTRHNLWNQMKYKDREAIKVVRRAVNGGTNGLNEVYELFDYYYNLITK